MNELVRQKLCEIIIRYGHSIGEDPKRCEALLRDLCGQYPREISLLINSMKQGIIADILVSENSMPLAILLARLTERLQQNLYLSEEAARWAVESWALALGIITNIPEKTETHQIEALEAPTKSNLISINLRNLITYLGLILTGIGLAIFFGLSKVLVPPTPQPISSVTPNALPSPTGTLPPSPVNPSKLSPIEFIKEYYAGYPKNQCGDASVTSPFYRVYIYDAGSFDKITANLCKNAQKKGNKIQVAAFDEYQDAEKFKKFMELHFNKVTIEKRIW